MRPSETRRYANALVRWHADYAAAHAARRADKLMSDGDPEGAQAWRKIAKRIARQVHIQPVPAAKSPNARPARHKTARRKANDAHQSHM